MSAPNVVSQNRQIENSQPAAFRGTVLELDTLSLFNLQWRGEKLWVSCASSETRSRPPNSKEWLKSLWCLYRAQAICIAPELGETGVKFWAELGETIAKPAFIRIPSTSQLPQKRHQLSWTGKRAIDWIVAAVLLLALFPLLLGVAIAIRLDSPGPILFQQWRVGQRGQLFRILKFRTMFVNAERLHHQVMGNQPGLHKRDDDPRITSAGRWMRKYSLDELPQLVNVLRGEMSLVGPRPWALYDALRLEGDERRRLNALPGMTGAWQVKGRSQLPDLKTVNQLDLSYLHQWSLWTDLKIILQTIPKVLVGSGAC